LFSRSQTTAINVITYIASGGIIVGAIALFVVLSVFSGLRDFSLTFTNDFDPDYKILPKTGKSFTVNPNQISELKKISGYKNFSQVVEERVLFRFKEKQIVADLKGIDANFTKSNKVATKLYTGQWLRKNSYQTVVGYGIANKLGMGVFDFNNALEVYVPKPGKGNIENPEDEFNFDELLPVGIYAISEDLDSKYVFTDLELAQELLNYTPNQLSGIELYVNNPNENQVTTSIQKIFGKTVEVKTRAELNATLLKMLNTENFVLYLIFVLVIIMVLFAFAGSIIMIIIDKKENLKTLMALGSEPNSVKKIFLIYGVSICAIAGLIGIIIGSLIVLAQKQYNLIMITETLPYPVSFTFYNYVVVFFTIVILGFVASYLASSRVKNTLLNR